MNNIMNDSTANVTHEIVYPISLTDFIPSICILLVIYLLCIFLIKDRQSFLKLRNQGTDPSHGRRRARYLFHRLYERRDFRIAYHISYPLFPVHVPHVLLTFRPAGGTGSHA